MNYIKNVTNKYYDNIILRIKNDSCIVATVNRPFRTAYWPSISELAKGIGITDYSYDRLHQPECQMQLLSAITAQVPELLNFTPRIMGFTYNREDIRALHIYKNNNISLSFIGNCSREVIMRSMELLKNKNRGISNITVNVILQNVGSEWSTLKTRIDDISEYGNCWAKNKCCINIYAEQYDADSSIIEYLYNRPNTRLGWFAEWFAYCDSIERYKTYINSNNTVKNILYYCQKGVIPELILPVSCLNANILPEIVKDIVILTRGCRLALIPTQYLKMKTQLTPANIQDYIKTITTIYGDPNIPTVQVYPQSWVAERFRSESFMPASLESAGAAVAILPNGALYPGEFAINNEQWKIGNVLDCGAGFLWERLDVIPELFTRNAKCVECNSCDWRFRCGGYDGTTSHNHSGNIQLSSNIVSSLFDYYCKARKVLFESMLWGSVNAATIQSAEYSNEHIELKVDCVEYKKTNNNRDNICK